MKKTVWKRELLKSRLRPVVLGMLAVFLIAGTLVVSGCGMMTREARILVSLKEGFPQNPFIWNTAYMAVEDWNADGSHQVKGLLLPYNYSGDDATAMGASFQETIKKTEPVAIIGSVFSSDVIRLMPKIHAARVPYMTQGTISRLTDQGLENLYRIQASDEALCFSAIRHIARGLKAKKIAILYSESEFGEAAKDDLERAAAGQNLKLVKVASYPRGGPMDKALISAVNQSGADVCILWADFGEYSMILKALEKTPLKMPFFGSPDFQSMGGEKRNLKPYEGSWVIGQFTYLPSQEYFRDKVEKRFGYRPTNQESPAVYDAVTQILTALEYGKIKPGDTHALNQELHDMTYTGICGTYAYDENGEGIRQGYISQIKGGKLVFDKISASAP